MGDSDSDIDLAELDAMSSDDDSEEDETNEKSEAPGALGSFMSNQEKKRNKQLQDFEGFDEGDDNTVAQKMKAVLELRAQLGIDDDKSFMAEQERKEQEKKKMEKMSHEERMSYEEDKAGDVMARIRAKHAKKMKDVEARRAKEKKVLPKKDDGFASFGDGGPSSRNGAGNFASFDENGEGFEEFGNNSFQDGDKKKKKKKVRPQGLEPVAEGDSEDKPRKPRKLKAPKADDGEEEEESMLDVLARTSLSSEDGPAKRKKKKSREVPEQGVERSMSSSSLKVEKRRPTRSRRSSIATGDARDVKLSGDIPKKKKLVKKKKPAASPEQVAAAS